MTFVEAIRKTFCERKRSSPMTIEFINEKLQLESFTYLPDVHHLTLSDSCFEFKFEVKVFKRIHLNTIKSIR